MAKKGKLKDMARRYKEDRRKVETWNKRASAEGVRQYKANGSPKVQREMD